MSVTALRSMLVHTCDVKRRAAGSDSAHGHNTGAWTTMVSGAACRFMENTGRELEQPVQASDKTWRVFFEFGTDVEFRDRLTRDGVDYTVIDVVDDVAGAGEMMRVTVERVTA